MKGFLDFVRKQGVVGLAVGFILGGSVKDLIFSLIKDIINPVLGVILGSTKGLAAASLKIGSVELMWGHFLSVLIDFLVIALVVYYGVKGLGLDKLDKKEK